MRPLVKGIIRSLTLVSVLMTLLCPVQATSIPQTVSAMGDQIEITGNENSGPVSESTTTASNPIFTFDGRLGILTSVSFGLEGTLSGGFECFTTESFIMQCGGEVQTKLLALSQTSISPWVLYEADCRNFSGLAPPGCRAFAGTDNSISLSASSTSLADLAAVTGTGAETYTIDIQLLVNTLDTLAPDPFVDHKVGGGFNLTVEYGYTPTSNNVPEPATFLLLAIGLIGTTGVRARTTGNN